MANSKRIRRISDPEEKLQREGPPHWSIEIQKDRLEGALADAAASGRTVTLALTATGWISGCDFRGRLDAELVSLEVEVLSIHAVVAAEEEVSGG